MHENLKKILENQWKSMKSIENLHKIIENPNKGNQIQGQKKTVGGKRSLRPILNKENVISHMSAQIL